MSETQATISSPIEESQPVTEQVEQVQEQNPKKDFLAPKFAALTKKEKQVREYEKSVRAQMAQIEQMKSEIEAKSKASQDQEAQLIKQLKANPLKFMKDHGLTFEELTTLQLNDENPTPEMQLRRMKEELENGYKSELEELKKSLKEREEKEAQAQYEKAVAAYKNELSQFVKQNSETYELLANRPEALDMMFDIAKHMYESGEDIPEISQLAQAVEEHFEEEARQILKLKKFNLNTEASKPKVSAPKTLSNTLATDVPKSDASKLSKEESLKHAASMIRWTAE